MLKRTLQACLQEKVLRMKVQEQEKEKEKEREQDHSFLGSCPTERSLA